MNTNLENNKFKTGFKIPEGYFENFDNKLFNLIDKSELSIKENHGFILTDNYFEKSKIQLYQIIDNNSKVVQLKPKLFKILSWAAIITLSILSPMIYDNLKNDSNIWNTEKYLELSTDEISEYEMSNFLSDEDINSLENELVYNDLLNNI